MLERNKLFVIKDDIDKKTESIARIRVTKDEKDLIFQKAGDCCLSVSEYMLRSALGRPVRSKTEAVIIHMLSRLGEQQKVLFAKGGGMYSEEYKQILDGIVDAILAIAEDKVGKDY